MENESLNYETLQQMLEQMKQLNQNFAEFKEYIEERDKKSDEEQAKQEQQQSEQQIKDSTLQQESVDTYLAKLTDIHTALTDFEKGYEDTSTTLQGSVENIEYNTNFDFVFSAVTVGILALLVGILIGRIFFRKL